MQQRETKLHTMHVRQGTRKIKETNTQKDKHKDTTDFTKQTQKEKKKHREETWGTRRELIQLN